ncbi:ATP-NAD kinase family protein [Psychrobium sp. 1_MG-2023]|uniref:ATP-NAD kinase family protein n=1 Tax=Psychrobium sp. 1_MG-2023 TaxID=3062624 RepID=UPI000C321A12|nr:ATP-NAD kinase family protein [Psychrobium sp. 1_MG-2023]MDP2560188.1 ATP-NAD kinase family protein [Psychrobium sp. 1_MG-2023]PKF56999.1 ATP-NAD kinase [Alteromonadales bacterium alter-6D02]
MKIKFGLIINPVAGLGGSVALKGSDNVAEQALILGAQAKANSRAEQALAQLVVDKDKFEIITAAHLMGQSLCQSLGLSHQVIDFEQDSLISDDLLSSDSKHTIDAAMAIKKVGVDCLIFVGGDGTARNIYSAVGDEFPVLGIPAGVKIHSGVYAITPKAAGKVLSLILSNQLVSLMERDVMDIDESLFRQGIVKAKRYGEMTVPAELRYMQAVKMGGKESDELVLADIAADVIREIDDGMAIIGSGSTTAFLMEEMGLDNTLLGVDVVNDQRLIGSDVSAKKLLEMIESYQSQMPSNPIKLVVTLIGGQGHIFGRGNQQLSPQVIRAIGRENIIVIATKTKLEALNQRPLLVDTGDMRLDEELCGLIKITTGYQDYVMYQIANPEHL